MLARFSTASSSILCMSDLKLLHAKRQIWPKYVALIIYFKMSIYRGLQAVMSVISLIVLL